MMSHGVPFVIWVEIYVPKHLTAIQNSRIDHASSIFDHSMPVASTG
jgi:hypothetical protein